MTTLRHTVRQVGITMLREIKFSTVAFIVGVPFLAMGFYYVWEATHFMQTASAVPGRVVQLEWRPDKGPRAGRADGAYITVFTFSDTSGTTHTGRTSMPQEPATHDVGDDVVVIYQPGSPETARIRSFQTLWLSPIVFSVVGLILVGFGASAFVTARTTRRTTPHETAA